MKTQFDLQAMITGFKSRIIESALNGELNHHLEISASNQDIPDNRRNGFSSKTVKTSSGDIPINVPRDRTAEFDTSINSKA